jgi:hypothetical protein
MEIKVLWIDDQPNDAFMDNAYNVGIDIRCKKNVDDGIDELLHSSESYDAIILDANCIYHTDGKAEDIDISALGYALRMITKNNIGLPWFVYSAGGEQEHNIEPTVKAYERDYDDVHWYRKPAQMNDLFKKIKEVAGNSELYKLKAKYSDACDWYPRLNELVEILKYVEEDKKLDSSVFNLIRKELDWIMDYCYKCGLLQEPYNGSNLGECSNFLGNKLLVDYVPSYVQRAFHTTTSLSNEGSHRLKLDSIVKSGQSPFLVHSIVMELLNIIHWAKQLPIDEQSREELKNDIAKTIKDEVSPKAREEYEGKEHIVNQDANRNYYCGDCLLQYTKADGLKGRTVILKNLKPNKSKTSGLYRFFADFDTKD